MGVFKKIENEEKKQGNEKEKYTLFNPINEKKVKIYEMKEDQIVNYGNDMKTKIITAKVVGDIGEETQTSEQLVCFEIPEYMKKEELYENGVLNVLTYNGAFYNLKKEEYNHIGRISEFAENNHTGYGYAIEPPTGVVLNYVKRSLNRKSNGIISSSKEKKELYSIPNGYTKEGIRSRQESVKYYIQQEGENSYTVKDPNSGETIILKNVNIVSNINHSNGERSTLYTCKRITGGNLGNSKNVSFELPMNIGNIAKSGNENQIKKLVELVSDQNVANYCADHTKKGTNKNLTFIGNLQYTGEEYQVTDGASQVLGYVDELSNILKF